MADTPITDYTKLDAGAAATIAANAKSQGITPQEYLTARGGVYKSGYFGDTPEYRRIPDELYSQLVSKGSGAINTEILKRTKEAYQKDPSLIENPALRMAFMAGRISIDDVMRGIGLDKTKAQPLGFEQIGALADGTPLYGWDAKGNPVTNPNGTIYSRTSPSEAIANANSGASPLTFSSSSTATGATGMTDQGFAERKSAYDLLYQQFSEYGLGSLVEPLKALIMEGVSPSEFTLRLRETDAYKKRFAANAQRIAKGLRALSEAEYIQLEDQYQNVMRNYGLPAEYYTRGDMGIQPGFEKFIAGDVSAAELEDRIQTAQNRVINAAPEVANTLRQFYPDITNGDILAYALDPNQALTNIKRKIGAAEIGAGAAMAGLSTGLTRAEELQRYGVTGEAARAGYQAIGSMLPRATQLGDIYAKSGLGPYDQMTAEAEVFGTPGATEAQRKRQRLTQLEQAQFGGSSGATGGALGRERAGQF